MTVLPTDEDLTAMRYEQLVETLEDLTRRMSDGEVGIEEATDLYERAKVVHRMAGERLDAVKRRIDEIDAAATRPGLPSDPDSIPEGPLPSES